MPAVEHVLAALGLLLVLGLVRELACHLYYPWQGRLLLRLGRVQQAAARLRAYLVCWTLAGGRRKLSARFTLAHCLYRLGNFEEALGECQTILEAAGHDSRLLGLAQQMRADCLDHLGQGEAADEARRAAGDALARQRSTNSFAQTMHVDELEAAGDAFGALRLLQEIEAHAGSDEYGLSLRLRLARLSLRLGYYSAAMVTAETLLGRAGLPSELQHDSHAVAARAYLELEQLPQAERDARAAFRISNLAMDRETLVEDCLLLAEVALHQGDYVEGMRQFQRVRECGGNGRWLAAAGEAEYLHMWGRTAEAQAAFEQALKRVPSLDNSAGETPTMALSLAYAAFCYRTDPERAGRLVEPYLRRRIVDPRLGVRRDVIAAVVLTTLERTSEAATFREALEAARLAFAHDRHLQVELDIAAAEVARLEGRLPAAAAAYRAALDRPPYRILLPTIALRLGDVLLEAGDTPGAREAFEQAAGFAFELGAVDEARRRLRGLGGSTPASAIRPRPAHGGGTGR